MALTTLWLADGETIDANDVRLAMALFLPGPSPLAINTGVRYTPGDPCKILNPASGRQVLLNPGVFAIQGTDATDQGFYIGANRSQLAVPIDPGDATNPRWDVITAQATDTGTSTSDLLSAVVKGNPAASPAIPATPGNAVAFGAVLVPAGVAADNLATATIADLRKWVDPTRAPAASTAVQVTSGSTGTTTSTSWTTTLSGASALSTSFVAPDSGKVLVLFGANLRKTDGTHPGAIFASVRLTGPSGYLRDPADAEAIRTADVVVASNFEGEQPGGGFLVTGLTPAASYTAIMVHKSGNAALIGTYWDRRITVAPTT